MARLLSRLRVPLNLEMSIAPDVVAVALRLRPHQVTLVPERRKELTTEGGLDVVRLGAQLARLVRRFHGKRIAVSLFVDPVASQLVASAATGARIVELHTGRYANAVSPAQREHELAVLRRAAGRARKLELAVAAGHGLDYQNVKAVTAIRQIEELNIGFSIIARSLVVGLARAVREMKTLMRRRT